MTMTHPGLPITWALGIVITMLLTGLGVMLIRRETPHNRVIRLAGLPLIGIPLQRLLQRPWLQLGLKIFLIAVFLLIIAAGLYGTPIAERNFATVMTWNIWWAALIISIFFLGTTWCGVCPWDTLASWLVRHRLWGRSTSGLSLNLKVPKVLRNLWPALLLLIILTWLELGVGITTNPKATASLALLIVVLAVISAALYEDKAFCRFFCPVGRTVGAYSQLSLIELRPIEPDICTRCSTLECYRGNEKIAPCPMHLVMGRLTQNTYCTACGNCLQSCPEQNIHWQIRSPSREAIRDARPRWDEAWFMLGLLALTSFHGITMLPTWESLMTGLAQQIGDSGNLLVSFSLGLGLNLAVVAALFALAVKLTQWLSGNRQDFRQIFSAFSFVALPLAFAYHLAHNLNHLVRENSGLTTLIINPLGNDTQPLGMMEKHMRHLQMLISQDSLVFLQALLMVFGFWIAMRIIRQRRNGVLPGATWSLLPMVLFAVLINLFHVWILMQPMAMRL
ncbi:Nitrogen assimilation regulatory protein [hydrothermal vent metagenome]|uniref:Nitrogen assimilation regulatory protein n=1 Tax=hydrothermal vent metagenome TaxID=652676 RepID=A0A3B1AVS8_9ZZZZ